MQSLKQLWVSVAKLKSVNEIERAYTGWLLFQQEHAKTPTTIKIFDGIYL